MQVVDGDFDDGARKVWDDMREGRIRLIPAMSYNSGTCSETPLEETSDEES